MFLIYSFVCVSILVDMFYEFLFVIHSTSILFFNCFVFISKFGITSSCGFSLFGLMLWFLYLLITGQEYDYISGGKLSTFIFLEEDLTLLPHYPHRTNQGSICFILLPSLLLHPFY